MPSIRKRGARLNTIPAAEAEKVPLPFSRDRRRHARLYACFPIVVRGVDVDGTRFTHSTCVINMSAHGLYLNLERRIVVGTRLFAVIRLSTAPDQYVPAPVIAVAGVVRRVELQPGNECGIALSFTRSRQL